MFAQRDIKTDEIRGYMAVSRIKWELPKSFEYLFAVPHFTVGPRIKCKGSQYDCEISVASRDISVKLEQRRDELAAKLAPYLQRSEEKTLQVRTFGTRPEVTYVTLTDSRPNPGEFRILTTGFSVNGPAVIHFQHLSNDLSQIQQILDVVQGARAMDALEILAWKLNDYKTVCEERNPAYKQANDVAFQASPFPSVDIARFWQTVPLRKVWKQFKENLRPVANRSRRPSTICQS